MRAYGLLDGEWLQSPMDVSNGKSRAKSLPMYAGCTAMLRVRKSVCLFVLFSGSIEVTDKHNYL